jgi:allophanate hydrolase
VHPRRPATLRLGLPEQADLEFFGDEGQKERFAAGSRRVADVVAEAVPVELGPLFEAGDLLYKGPWVAERLAALGDFLDSHPDSVLPVTRTVLERGYLFDAVAAFRGQHRLRELHAWTARLFERIDVLALPTTGTTYTHAQIAEEPLTRNLDLGRYTQFANLLDLAAVTVPNGLTVDGRPASLTLIGPAFSDATLIRLATEVRPEGGTTP